MNKYELALVVSAKLEDEERAAVEMCIRDRLEGTVSLTNEELLTLKTDVLIPAALENQINASNADKIQAKLIVEAANGPVTAEADVILQRKNIPVVPDILANAGGVIASYFEWVQNSQSLSCLLYTSDFCTKIRECMIW